MRNIAVGNTVQNGKTVLTMREKVPLLGSGKRRRRMMDKKNLRGSDGLQTVSNIREPRSPGECDRGGAAGGGEHTEPGELVRGEREKGVCL